MTYTPVELPKRWRRRGDGTFGPPAHWYFITRIVCVLCGATEELRERRYGRRPADDRKRSEHVETACPGHFL